MKTATRTLAASLLTLCVFCAHAQPQPAPSAQPPMSVSSPSPGTASLTWNAPLTMADGSPVVGLAGYKVYFGQTSGSYTQSAPVVGAANTALVIQNLTAGTWYFAVTSVDTAGNESEKSSQVSKTF